MVRVQQENGQEKQNLQDNYHSTGVKRDMACVHFAVWL